VTDYKGNSSLEISGTALFNSSNNDKSDSVQLLYFGYNLYPGLTEEIWFDIRKNGL